MTKLEMVWPDQGEERIRSARGRLLVAGDALRQRDLQDRIKRISQILGQWTQPDSPWRRELFNSFLGASGLSAETLREGLESALRAWEPAAFEACAQREIVALIRTGGLQLAPFRCMSVLAGGALPMPTISSILFPLALGSPVLLRETSADSVTGALVARSIAELDEEMAKALEIVRFPAEDDAALGAFLDSDCVVATGSDETMASFRARLRPDQRFVAYGHRFSIALFGPRLMDSSEAAEEALRGLALDITRWDQRGCLSPVVLYLVGLPLDQRIDIAQRLSGHLAEVSTDAPLGEVSTPERASLSTELAEAKMRAAVSESVHVFESPGAVVALEETAAPRPAPLCRFLRVLPVADLTELGGALRPFERHLSNAAVAGFSDREQSVLGDTLSASGISRITHPGRLQTPPIDWPHDGQPALLPLARFVQASFSEQRNRRSTFFDVSGDLTH